MLAAFCLLVSPLLFIHTFLSRVLLYSDCIIDELLL